MDNNRPNKHRKSLHILPPSRHSGDKPFCARRTNITLNRGSRCLNIKIHPRSTPPHTHTPLLSLSAPFHLWIKQQNFSDFLCPIVSRQSAPLTSDPPTPGCGDWLAPPGIFIQPIQWVGPPVGVFDKQLSVQLITQKHMHTLGASLPLLPFLLRLCCESRGWRASR